ncbi:MAG: hypothetical protein RSG77_25700, partial [Hafnia sp.]
AFTQTQYCYRDQARGASGHIWNGSGWIVDPANPYRVETVTHPNQPNYQTAIGTKPIPVCKSDVITYISYRISSRGVYTTDVKWDGDSFNASGHVPQVQMKGYVYYPQDGTMSLGNHVVCRIPM